MNAVILPSDEDIRNVLAYAATHAGDSLKARTEIMLWPWGTRSAPAYWRDFCERWPVYLGIPPKLSPCTAAAVLFTIIRAMSDDERGELVTFLSYNTIAERAHVNRKTVQRAIAWQKDARVPLVFAMRVDRTKGIAHPTYRFTLVKDPLVFAAKRDETRAAKRDEFRTRYRNGESDAVRAVQRARLMAPDDDPQSDRDLHQGISAAIERARGGLPRKVVVPLVAPTGSLLNRQDKVSHKTIRGRY